MNLKRPLGLDLVFCALLLSFWFAQSDCSRTEETSEVPPGWQPLFDGESLSDWASTKFGGEGWVRVKDGAIVLSLGDSMTGITWTGDFPENDYEIYLEAQRVQGSDFFCGVTFPVGDSFCSLILGGWGGAVVGISNLDGLDASENETSRLKRFENGRWYEVRLSVSQFKIEAWIDDEQFVDLLIRGRQLDVRPEVRLSRPFGVASWQTTSALREIRIRIR